MIKREDLRIRDPFILTDREKGCYYMYGTTALQEGTIRSKTSFSVYRTRDLEHFEGPIRIVDGESLGLWATRDFWAAEVHKYRGKYYLFGSIKSDDRCRATQIFVCDRPDGTFVPVAETARTPDGWECLDGTLYIEDDVPYMVFCHEWMQVKDGEICAIALSPDLSCTVGEPFLLFRASDNPEVTPHKEDCYVTDGPFLYRENGKLRMIWSSFSMGRYIILEAESTGGIRDLWKHRGSRFPFDGGHAMLFETLEGKRYISLHSPNHADLERPFFFPYEATDGSPEA